jgi:hypothetical protein
LRVHIQVFSGTSVGRPDQVGQQGLRIRGIEKTGVGRAEHPRVFPDRPTDHHAVHRRSTIGSGAQVGGGNIEVGNATIELNRQLRALGF